MKHWLPLLFAFVTVHAGAGEFRFHHMETTGLCDCVHAGNGKKTTIVITEDSDAAAVALLNALLDEQIYGTQGVEDRQDAKWEQGVILIGEFTSETKRTKTQPDSAAPEDYRDFRITGIKVLFPLSRFQIAPGGNPIDGPIILETHFSFASLFPSGLVVNGKPIDLGKYAKARAEPK